ncbi:MAG: Septum formation protein Maf [Puniceicoccaceae bacterium MED-G32]|jgi:septum formation protein|nr:MAG: Septum formation protein Maf [Puniceicoccaceae bacterium MED-G32]|tara:strand:- start:2655 stop:3242 length:588 start_codon:yes stop_codon:yes gene_type:complete
MHPNQLILASASPRRKTLLDDMGLAFAVQVANVEEDDRPHLKPDNLVLNNAILKAESVAKEAPDALVLGSDTTVAFEGRIFSKPQDLNEAMQMLETLSDQWHEVYSAISLRWTNGDFKESFYEVSQVKFRALTPSIIRKYHSRVNPLDKAGAYGIQEASDLIIDSIKGSFNNIMGLPTELLANQLKKHGFNFFTD